MLAKDGVSDLPDYGWLLALASDFPRFQGDFERARVLTERAIEVLRGCGQRNRLALALRNLGSVATNQGEYEEARALHEESLALGREIDSPLAMALALNGLTVLAFRQGDFVLMRDLANENLELSRVLNENQEGAAAAALHNLGEALRHQGELAAAAESYEEALRLYLHVGEWNGEAECLDGIGDLAARIGEFAVAASLWATARRLLEANGDRPWDLEGTEQGIAEARAALGPAAFEKSWRSGTAMSREEAAATAARIVALVPLRSSHPASTEPPGAFA